MGGSARLLYSSQRRIFSWDLEVGFLEVGLERQAEGAHIEGAVSFFEKAARANIIFAYDVFG